MAFGLVAGWSALCNVTDMETTDKTTLVLGLGNTLLTDEAVGVRVVERLQGMPVSAGLTLRDGGTMGLTLLVEMEDADAMVVVDAAWLQSDPGTMRVFEGAEMDHFLRTRGRNPHDIGLDDLMDALRLREAVPEHRALVGIEPASLSVGDSLSPAVALSVPKAAAAVLGIVEKWQSRAV